VIREDDVLTQAENELLTQFGPGTPAGELLRRYWHPVAIARDLTDEQPTKFIRIMSEDLVLFKDKSGHVGLIQDQCAHRGASMMYGRVEERGISCAYHGWLYDTKGNCLETPAEPADSKFHLTVKMKAYPVQKFIGMYWAYLGPLPAPEIPKIDVWVRKDGRRKIGVRPLLDCNWLQAMENSADSAHLQILHQDATGRGAPPNTTRGFIDTIAELDYYETPLSLMKVAVYKDGKSDTHPLLFPNILRQGDGTHIRVPIDDTHTWIYDVRFVPTEDGAEVDDENPEIRPFRTFKTPEDGAYPTAKFRMDEVPAQDYMAWESQGPIANRTVERLATSDRGVVMYRQMLMREIAKVQQGEDPMGVIRDPNHEVIETNLDESLEHMGLMPPGRREFARA
jgi:5,5'-dehydrodivanillate O-demethylase